MKRLVSKSDQSNRHRNLHLKLFYILFLGLNRHVDIEVSGAITNEVD